MVTVTSIVLSTTVRCQLSPPDFTLRELNFVCEAKKSIEATKSIIIRKLSVNTI